MHGVTSICFELHEQVGYGDHVFRPAGGAGLCMAVARGFKTFVVDRQRGMPPTVHYVQPDGDDAMASPIRNGELKSRSVDCTTCISGLQVLSVIHWDLVIKKCRPTGGTVHQGPDEQIWQA